MTGMVRAGTRWNSSRSFSHLIDLRRPAADSDAPCNNASLCQVGTSPRLAHCQARKMFPLKGQQMRIALVAPLAEAVPPKLYGGTERVVSWLRKNLFGNATKSPCLRAEDRRRKRTSSFACRKVSGLQEFPIILAALSPCCGRCASVPMISTSSIFTLIFCPTPYSTISLTMSDDIARASRSARHSAAI